MNFNNQISTNKEQSERLLKLGLRKDTADLYDGSIFNTNTRPSWSLSGLLSMCDDTIRFGKDYIVCAMDFETKTNNGFDGIIDCIEWLISKNMFNKNYLTK